MITTRTALLLCLFSSVATQASAHAQLESASPAVGSTVTSAPAAITLDFSEAVEPRFSRVSVTGPSGAVADQGDLHTAPGLGTRLVLGLKAAGDGPYTVTWHAVSVDTHKTQGSYRFVVGHE